MQRDSNFSVRSMAGHSLLDFERLLQVFPCCFQVAPLLPQHAKLVRRAMILASATGRCLCAVSGLPFCMTATSPSGALVLLRCCFQVALLRRPHAKLVQRGSHVSVGSISRDGLLDSQALIEVLLSETAHQNVESAHIRDTLQL